MSSVFILASELIIIVSEFGWDWEGLAGLAERNGNLPLGLRLHVSHMQADCLDQCYPVSNLFQAMGYYKNFPVTDGRHVRLS